MKFKLEYDRNLSTESIANTIALAMINERKASFAKGYWFNFGDGETCHFKRDCPAFQQACESMAREYRRGSFVTLELISKNMNGDTAIFLHVNYFNKKN